ncbi:MAG: hypothetical protein ABMA14_25880 [Hyphomonadaceae bacterium]
MTDLSHKLGTVLAGPPICVGLFSQTRRVLGRMGGRMAGLHRNILPSQDPREAARWRFVDDRRAVIPRTHWASARALRGEWNDEGLVSSVWQGELPPVRVTCVPTVDRDSDVAGVSFLQFLDPSVADDTQTLQQRLIRELASAVSSNWQRSQPAC